MKKIFCKKQNDKLQYDYNEMKIILHLFQTSLMTSNSRDLYHH